MQVFALDGHPDQGRLASALLDAYCDGAEASGHTVTRMALRDMTFDPVLHRGYAARQEHEPDIVAALDALKACDHWAIAFPMWWGGQPALLKGFFDRALLPGIAFRYRDDNPMWDRLLAGRSAAALITGDTPSWWLSLVYGKPIHHQMRGQVFDFCGFKPAKIHYFGPCRDLPKDKADAMLARAEAAGRAAPTPKGAKVQ